MVGNQKNVSGNSDSKIKVSICCLTFNHKDYISQTLDSFLKQKTDFQFEILIHDDASTDGTSEIVRKYQSLYPTIIKPLIQEENQWSQGLRAMSITFNFSRAKGKYIAMCEGDDYWTDPFKLQKQVDFLDNNPEYVISYHDAKVIDENGIVIKESKMPKKNKRDYSANDLLGGKTSILTLTMMFRNLDIVRVQAEETRFFINGDNFITSLLGLSGKGKFQPEIEPAIYRQHLAGVWSKISEEKRISNKINTHYWMYRYYKRIGHEEAAKMYLKKLSGSVSLVDDEYRFVLVKKGILGKLFSGISKFLFRI